MNKTKIIRLQVPMTRTLKAQGVRRAKKYGYTSLQEIIRVFVTGFVKGKYIPTFKNGEEGVITQETQRKYAKMIAEHEKDVKKDTVKNIPLKRQKRF